MSSEGGKANGKLERARAIALYSLNPVICRNCNLPITVPDGKKVSEVRKQIFCSRSCAGVYNNIHFPKRSVLVVTAICSRCGNPFEVSGRKRHNLKRCPECTGKIFPQLWKIHNMSKGEVFSASISWQAARSMIQRHAREVYKHAALPKECKECGYSKHFDVCHILAVSEFPEDILVGVINDPGNLIALCKLHHWERDHEMVRGAGNAQRRA
jgi:hypothetical protein